MPKAQTSPAGRIIAFFRTTELDTARLVYGLCGDALRERTQKSEKAKDKAAKAKATPTPAAASAAAPARKAKTAKKKSHHKKRTPVQPALQESPDDARTAAEEAGDLVGVG